jgi:hypothetical protein
MRRAKQSFENSVERKVVVFLFPLPVSLLLTWGGALALSKQMK